MGSGRCSPPQHDHGDPADPAARDLGRRLGICVPLARVVTVPVGDDARELAGNGVLRPVAAFRSKPELVRRRHGYDKV